MNPGRWPNTHAHLPKTGCNCAVVCGCHIYRAHLLTHPESCQISDPRYTECLHNYGQYKSCFVHGVHGGWKALPICIPASRFCARVGCGPRTDKSDSARHWQKGFRPVFRYITMAGKRQSQAMGRITASRTQSNPCRVPHFD